MQGLGDRGAAVTFNLYNLTFRSPDVVVSGFRSYCHSIFFYILSSAVAPSQLAERNSTIKTDHMFGSDCDLKMHVQNLGYSSSPIKDWGPQSHLFSTVFDDVATIWQGRR